MTHDDPNMEPGNKIQVEISGTECRSLISRDKVPDGTPGIVTVEEFAYLRDNAIGTVHFWWKQPDHTYRRYFIDVRHVKLTKAQSETITAKRLELDSECQKKHIEELKVSQSPVVKPSENKQSTKVVHMSVANFDKLEGKYVVAIAEAKDAGKFEFGVLCLDTKGQPAETPNINTPIGFENLTEAEEFIVGCGMESCDKTSIMVFQVAKVK